MNKELTESLSKAQKELNIQVNKAAKAETENVRAGKINKKLEEICDNKGVFERKEPARRSKSSDDESKKPDKRFGKNNRSRNEKCKDFDKYGSCKRYQDCLQILRKNW